MNKKYKPRVVDKRIRQYLSAFGAVCIEGPKWCGKTWSARFHSKSEILIGSSEKNFQNRTLAEISPSAVLEGEVPRLIDEWQEVPPLWDAIRHEVDIRGEVGQFLITGSATPNHKGIMHSGAGRIARLRMRPMSLFESGDSNGKVSLRDLLVGEEWADWEKQGNSPQKLVRTGDVDLKEIMKWIVRGGWPSVIGQPEENHGILARQYMQAILEDDVFRIDGIRRDSKKMLLLLKSLARNESTTASNKVLERDIKETDDKEIHIDTVAEYLDLFRRLYLTENQPPFSQKVRSSLRLKQSEKRHFVDPSLACALLGMSPEHLIHDLETAGFLFESLCERDLRIYAEDMDATLFHYQDYSNREIDAVIEMPSGDWYAFEIKLGTNQIDQAAENLLKLSRAIANEKVGKSPKRLFVICGLSGAVYQRRDGVIVVPISCLKP